MSKVYTKQEILDMCFEAGEDIATFYKQDFINYRGKTADTDEYYTEIIALWCCENLKLLSSIPTITREATYKTKTHDGVPHKSDSNRDEELIAMAMFRQVDIPIVGKIIDYQTPLKNKRTDRAGKIDLLGYDGKALRILELKEPESEETMLRCVLEGYTYMKTVDAEKLVSNFCLPSGTQVFASPFVFADRAQHTEMKQDRPHLKKLMNLLNSKPYYIRIDNEKYIAEE